MKKIGIRILSNAGYGLDQVVGITIRELKDLVDELINEYEEETEIITIDAGNKYGAKYGKIYPIIINDVDEYEDEEY